MKDKLKSLLLPPSQTTSTSESLRPHATPVRSRLHGRHSFSLATSPTSWRDWKSPSKADYYLRPSGREWKPAAVASTEASNGLRMLGPWRIGESLGQGSSGRVRIARSIETGRFAAIKKVRRLPRPHQDSDSIEREISIMKLVQHPYIVQLLDVFETPTQYFLITEYCQHGELYTHLMKNKLSGKDAKKYFGQIVMAVAHLHRFNIAHRDIKFENCLLIDDPNGPGLSVKLSDCGMATFQAPGTLSSTSCGSPHYAGPEVIAGEMHDAQAADIWSLGVVLFAMLTRRLPFDDDNIPEMLHKIKQGHYTIPSSMKGAGRDLIEKMLFVDWGKRIKIEDVMGHEFLKDHRPSSADYGQLSFSLSLSQNVELSDDPLEYDILTCLKPILRLESEDQVANQVLHESATAEQFYVLLRRFRNLPYTHTEVAKLPSRKASFLSSSEAIKRRSRSLSPPASPSTSRLPPDFEVEIDAWRRRTDQFPPFLELPVQSPKFDLDGSTSLERNTVVFPSARNERRGSRSLPSTPKGDNENVTSGKKFSLRGLFASSKSLKEDLDHVPVTLSRPATPERTGPGSPIKRPMGYDSLKRTVWGLKPLSGSFNSTSMLPDFSDSPSRGLSHPEESLSQLNGYHPPRGAVSRGIFRGSENDGEHKEEENAPFPNSSAPSIPSRTLSKSRPVPLSLLSLNTPLFPLDAFPTPPSDRLTPEQYSSSNAWRVPPSTRPPTSAPSATSLSFDPFTLSRSPNRLSLHTSSTAIYGTPTPRGPMPCPSSSASKSSKHRALLALQAENQLLRAALELKEDEIRAMRESPRLVSGSSDSFTAAYYSLYGEKDKRAELMDGRSFKLTSADRHYTQLLHDKEGREDGERV